MTTLTNLLVDVARLGAWLVLLALLFVPVEGLFALHGRRGGWRFADLGYYFLNGMVPVLMLAPVLALFATLARTATPEAWLAWVTALPFAVKMVVALIVGEIGAYWGHRWCHEVPLLWRFHAVHHSIEHIDWLANTRAHPLDVVFVRLCGLVPVYMLGLADTGASGASAMIPVYVTLVGTVWSFLVHANVRWRFGWLEQVAATPAFHHWHHTNGVEGRDRNYAAMFPWVDRLFGTFHLPRDSWPPVYGVDHPVRGGIAAELWQPFVGDGRDGRAPPPAAGR